MTKFDEISKDFQGFLNPSRNFKRFQGIMQVLRLLKRFQRIMRGFTGLKYNFRNCKSKKLHSNIWESQFLGLHQILRNFKVPNQVSSDLTEFQGISRYTEGFRRMVGNLIWISKPFFWFWHKIWFIRK